MEIYEIQCRQFVEIFLPGPRLAVSALTARLDACKYVANLLFGLDSGMSSGECRQCSGIGGMSNVKCWARHISPVRSCLITIRILNILA